MRIIVVGCVLGLVLGIGAAAAQQHVGDARECTVLDEAECEQPLIVTEGQCAVIAGNPDPRWRPADIDRMTNACWTCDDLDMDFRFGELLGFFRCQPRRTPAVVRPAPEPAWQQRDCTGYHLRRTGDRTLALTVRNGCTETITINACAVWYGGRERGAGSTTAAPGTDAVLRWPVDIYTRAQVVWNFCLAGEACPAPCPAP